MMMLVGIFRFRDLLTMSKSHLNEMKWTVAILSIL